MRNYYELHDLINIINMEEEIYLHDPQGIIRSDATKIVAWQTCDSAKNLHFQNIYPTAWVH